MLVEIEKIIVKDRIRKEFGNLQELADDIKENSLLNPITVVPAENGMYQLIAGERRLRACKLLAYTSIVVNTVSVKDAEQLLRIEISENENRKEFSFSERMDYAKRLEQIERIKADLRMKNPTQNFAEGEKGETAKKVSELVGFGNKETYRQAKYISDNADDETIIALDEGDISINAAYQKLMYEKKLVEEKAKKLERELMEKELHVSDKDLEIGELRLELKSALNKQPAVKEVPVQVIPDDYKGLKCQVEALKISEKKQREEAAQARNEATAYKHSLETWKSGGKSFDQISLPDFKLAIRAFLREVTPLTYMGEQFSAISSSDKAKFYEEIEIVERLLLDLKQALDGNKIGANLILIEGGNGNE